MLLPVLTQEGELKPWAEQSVVSSGIDSASPQNPRPAADKHEARRGEHYRIIAKALTCAEASFLRVGIPWLPPTERINSIKAVIDVSPDQFIREELVTVSTQALEAYCDDLETIGRDGVGMEELGLKFDSWSERYGFSMLFAGLVLLSSLLSSFFVMGNGILAIIMSLFLSSVGGAMGAYLGTDSARRCSFHLLLSREIMRRNGADPNAERVNVVCNKTAKSVSDSPS